MEEIKKPSESILIYDEKLKNNELSEKEERSKNKKTLFYSILGGSALLMFIAISLAIFILCSREASTQEVALITILITAPIILSLALMRYIYDGNKKDEPKPTLLLNVGKEIVEVLKDYLSKK